MGFRLLFLAVCTVSCFFAFTMARNVNKSNKGIQAKVFQCDGETQTDIYTKDISFQEMSELHVKVQRAHKKLENFINVMSSMKDQFDELQQHFHGVKYDRILRSALEGHCTNCICNKCKPKPKKINWRQNHEKKNCHQRGRGKKWTHP